MNNRNTLWIYESELKALQELQTNHFTFARCDAITELKGKIKDIKNEMYMNSLCSSKE